MTRAWRRFLSLVAAVPMTISGVAVASVPNNLRAPVDIAWAQALQQGSLEAFAHFAMTYPDSAYAEIAYARLSNPDAEAIAAAEANAASAQQSDDGSMSAPGFVPSSMMVV